MNDGPVFVVGVPRSGTTLLATLLNRHPHIAVCPETHYLTRYWEPCLAKTGWRHGRDAKAFTKALLAGREVADMGLDAATIQALQDRWDRSAPLQHAGILADLARAWADGRNRPRWGEKTPWHLDYVPILARWFPDARFLVIVRDPRDVALSHTKVPWGGPDMIGPATRWADAWDRTEDLLATLPSRIHRLRYEDLLDRPDETMRAVCAFLDEPYTDDLLTAPEAGDAPFHDREHWKSNSRNPLDPANQGRWKTGLTPAQARTVAAIAGPRLEAAGYGTAERSWLPPLRAAWRRWKAPRHRIARRMRWDRWLREVAP